MDFDAQRCDVLLLELASQMSLDEGGLGWAVSTHFRSTTLDCDIF